ncbi:MAG TPA: sigma 54-interacting transcriptional regulator [Polyangiaceae bacterium]|nr:sigma 54-interacting transcriptional regulator [Polyangiaceae bacterium]
MSVIETKTTPRESETTAPVCRFVVLHARRPAQRGRLLLLTENDYHVGREPAPGCLALDDDEVSRRHARLERQDESTFRLVDLGSRNGTFVNGDRTATAVIRDQDVVRIGGHVLLFQALGNDACRLILDPPPPAPGLVGESARMLAVREAIRRVAPGRAPVLVLGETGTGKERVAETIHRESGRTGPYLTLNCGALPHALIESELFGHVTGAFTGATSRRGLFAAASGGTLLLDEIGDMVLELQKALLRVLATGEVRPVGSDAPQKVDTRIVAATNVDLPRAVEEGRFRRDLHARLVESPIVLPPLRSRREDVLALLRHSLGAAHAGAELTTDAAEALLVYDYPYNVRELEQLGAAVASRLSDRRVIELQDLPDRVREPLGGRAGASGRAPAGVPPSLLGISREATPSREELVQLLELYKGNVSQVAAFLRRERRQVYRWAEQYAVDPAAYRSPDEA